MKSVEMKVGDHIRQGDVLVQKIASIPKRAKEIAREASQPVVLAYGEKTGHMHRLCEKQLCSFTTLDNAEVEFLLLGGSGGTLKHELANGTKAEHNAINLPEGKYELGQQIEYSPKELIRVCD